MLFAVFNPGLLFPSLLMTLKVILKLQFSFFWSSSTREYEEKREPGRAVPIQLRVAEYACV